MSNSNIPKLQLPIWQDVIYYLLLILAPIVLTSLELFGTSSTVFKWSFASIGSVLIIVILVKKFILKSKIDKLKEKCVLLEHDYSIQVGNPVSIRALWKRYNLILYIYNITTVLLSCALCYVFITALATQMIAFRGAALLIFLCIIAAMVFRVMCFISMIRENPEGANNE